MHIVNYFKFNKCNKCYMMPKYGVQEVDEGSEEKKRLETDLENMVQINSRYTCHCNLVRLHLLHKTCWVYTQGSQTGQYD